LIMWMPSNKRKFKERKENDWLERMFKDTFPIVVHGCGGSGKSALTIRFLQNHFVELYDPTIEDSYRKTETVDGVELVFNILDCAGAEEYSALRDQYIRKCKGAILVYDVTNRMTFDKIEGYHREVTENSESSYVSIVICGNKTDLSGIRNVSTEEGQSLAESLGCHFIETSAKTGENVEEAFFAVVRQSRLLNNNNNDDGNGDDDKKCVIC